MLHKLRASQIHFEWTINNKQSSWRLHCTNSYYHTFDERRLHRTSETKARHTGLCLKHCSRETMPSALHLTAIFPGTRQHYRFPANKVDHTCWNQMPTTSNETWRSSLFILWNMMSTSISAFRLCSLTNCCQPFLKRILSWAVGA